MLRLLLAGLVVLGAVTPAQDADVERLKGGGQAAMDAALALVGKEAAAVDAALEPLGKEADFWRKALEAELSYRKAGGAAPSDRRVSLKLEDVALDDALAQLAEKLQVSIDSTWITQSDPIARVTVELEDSSELGALLELSRRGSALPIRTGSGYGVYQSRFLSGTAWSDVALCCSGLELVRSVRFGGGDRRYVAVRFHIVTSVGSPYSTWPAVEIHDGADDAGRPVRALTAEESGEALLEEREYNHGGEPDDGTFDLRSMPSLLLAPPAEGAEKIARLRGFLVGRVSLESESVEFGPYGEKAVTERRGGVVIEQRAAGDPEQAPAPSANFRIMADGGRKALEAIGFEFLASPDAKTAYPCWSTAKWDGEALDIWTAPSWNPRDQSSGRLPDVKSWTVKIHRRFADRRVPFELKDLPLK